MKSKSYIIYRSRFQPEFGVHHKLAINELNKKFKEHSTILYGLVDDDLFHTKVEKKLLAKIEGLYNQIGKKDEFKKYKERFHPPLNPSSPGQIQSSIYNGLNGEQVQIFFTPNVVISSSVIYNNDGQPQDYEIISRYFLHQDAKSLKWFFPIFDKDDLNDLGFISAQLAKKNGNPVNSYPDIELIKFSRFNYYKNHSYVLDERNTFFGAYANALKSIAIRYLKSEKDKLDGMTLPDVAEVPYIYLFGELNKITDKIVEVLDYYLTVGTTNTLNDLNNILKTEKKIFEKFKDQLLDTTSNYAADLKNFHSCSKDLYIKIKDIHTSLNKFTDFKSGLKLIFEKENENCDKYCFQSKTDCKGCSTIDNCNTWLEDSDKSKIRCNNILKLLNSIMQ